MRRSDALYFTGYMWDTEVQKDAITRAIEVAKPAGARVVFDVADPFAEERYRADFLALIREHVDVVFANRREAGVLFGEQADDILAGLLGEHVEMGVHSGIERASRSDHSGLRTAAAQIPR